MIIRLADFERDALDIVEGAQDFLSRMDQQDFLPDDMTEVISGIATADFVEIIVAEENEKVVGGLGLAFVPYLWNPEYTSAEELFFWVDRQAPKTAALRLLRFAVKRIRTRGKVVASFKRLETSPVGLDRVYKKFGLNPVETAYMGVL